MKNMIDEYVNWLENKITMVYTYCVPTGNPSECTQNVGRFNAFREAVEAYINIIQSDVKV